MAGQALAPKIRRLFRCAGNGMGIVASAAPHLFSAHSFAGALGQVLCVAGDTQLRLGAGAHEHRKRVREAIAGVQHWLVFSHLRNADFSREVALLADTIPRGGGQPPSEKGGEA